jgi:hypothetical protein
MARNVTLAQLRERARQKADMQNSSFVSTDEIDGYINQSLTELVDLIVAREPDLYLDSADLSLVSGSYPLPSDFYQLRGVEIERSSGVWETIEPFNWNERNSLTDPILTAYGPTCAYRMRGNNLVLDPAQSSSQGVRVWYVPATPLLTGSADTFDGINGWDEYVTTDVAIKCKDKEESDVSVLMAQKANLTRRIETMVTKRDQGSPPRSVDIYATHDYYRRGY